MFRPMPSTNCNRFVAGLPRRDKSSVENPLIQRAGLASKARWWRNSNLLPGLNLKQLQWASKTWTAGNCEIQCVNVWQCIHIIWIYMITWYYMCTIVHNYNLSAPDPRDKGFVETGACSHVFLRKFFQGWDRNDRRTFKLQTPEKL